MGWNENEIDELGRSSLGSLEKEPPPLAFEKIRKRVLWYSFWTLGVGTIVRRFWMIPAATAVMVFISYWFFSPQHSSEKAQMALLEKQQDGFSSGNLISLTSEQPTATSSTEKVIKNNSESPLVSQTQNSQPINKSQFIGSASDPMIKTSNTNTASNNIAVNTQQSSTNNSNSQQVTENIQQSNSGMHATSEKTNNTVTELMALSKLNPIYGLMPELALAGVCTQTEIKNGKTKMLNWSVFAGANSGFSSAIINPQTESSSNIHRGFSAPVSPKLEFRAETGRWFFSTGIQQTVIDNEYTSENLLYNSREEYQLNLINQYWNVDSVGYWQYTYVSDSVIHVQDSIWAWQTDSLLVQQFDSVLQQLYDTLYNASWNRSLKLIEIPLMAGRSFIVNRFQIGISAGFGLGILYKSSGTIYAGPSASQPFLVVQNPTQKKLSVSFLCQGSVSYFLSERFAVEVSPYYRRMLTSPNFSEEYNTRKPWSAGLSAGIRYFF